MKAESQLHETEGIRHDYVDKVTGAACFVSDVVVPGMLHGRILRSPHPHALIKRIDASRALRMPGVVGVLTGADLAGLNPNWGMYLRDRPIIAVDKVRYVGDPVAAIAAVDEFTAEEALEQIEVEYEPLPFVVDAEEAMKPDAPLIHEAPETQKDFYVKGETRPVAGTNIFQHHQYRNGDTEQAFASAFRVFENEYSFPMVVHYAMEPHVAIADLQPNRATLWTCGQSLSAVQKVINQLFGYDLVNIRVISGYVGGGFGGKAFVKLDPLVAALSWKLGRPVRVCLSIDESMRTARRLSGTVGLKTAVDRDGRITAKSIRVVLNGGAYSDTGPIVAVKAAIRAIGPYRIPNLKIEAFGVYTNTIPGAAFRSIGGPQGVWATESQMDEIAHAMAIDPVQLRLENMVGKGEHIRPDLRPLDIDMASMLKLTEHELSSIADDQRAGAAAVGATDPGIFPLAAAMVRLKVDGSIVVHANTVEIGQGTHGVLRYVASKLLHQPLGRVQYAMPDTDIAPFDWGTGGSRSTVVMGRAVQMACEDIIRQLAQLAAEVNGGSPDDYALSPAGVSGNGKCLSISDLTYAGWNIRSGEYIGIGRVTPRTPGMTPAPIFWETSAGAGKIDVDADTGQIRLTTYVSAADCGRALNRTAAEGQDEGAAMMGIGHSLYEEIVYEDGQPLNASLIDYRVPKIDDTPQRFRTLLIESGDGPGPFGARGMGEGAILPVAPVIANALQRQYGVRIRELPLTPERVWRALRERSLEQESGPAVEPALEFRSAEASQPAPEPAQQRAGYRRILDSVRRRFGASDQRPAPQENAIPAASEPQSGPQGIAFSAEFVVPSPVANVWALFFDLSRIAGLIPGCSDVVELEPNRRYSAVMRQRLGVFKLEVPAVIVLEELVEHRTVRARATGTDKLTGTSVDVLLDLQLQELEAGKTSIAVHSTTQVLGKLAALGYPIVKKRARELFGEFEQRLRAELDA